MGLIITEIPGISRIDGNISLCGINDRPWNARDWNFDAILNVACDVSYTAADGAEYYKVDLSDDGSNPCSTFFRVIGMLECLVSQNKKVLLHCAAGISRSPTIAAMYYARRDKIDMNAVLAELKTKRDIINPNRDLWASAVNCINQTR